MTNAPRCSHLVIAATGAMAMRHTIAPAAVVGFKRWKAESAPERPQPKRRGVARQAHIVSGLLAQGWLPDAVAAG